MSLRKRFRNKKQKRLDMYMVSMKDIAKQCNVSVASVSKALNGYPDISEETRQLILKTASEMGYLPNSSARALKTKRSYNLGVLFVDEAMSGLTHDYFNHVLESFKRTAESKGYDITFTSGNLSGQRLNYYEHCRYRGVDGVVIACINFFTEEVQRLVQSEIPVVTIDHVFAGYDGLTFARILEPRLTTLCQDTETIGRLAAQKLIDLIENPKATIIDKFTVDGTLFPGASVRNLAK